MNLLSQKIISQNKEVTFHTYPYDVMVFYTLGMPEFGTEQQITVVKDGVN